MNMDESVIKTSETTNEARQSMPDPVLHSMRAIARQQYEFEQSLLSQQLWSQQQAVSMEVSIKAVAIQAAVQANGISHILKGKNDISKEEVVQEIQSDRVIEELKSSWKTPSWHSSASRLTSGSPMGHKDDLKEEKTCPAEGFTSERHHKDNRLDPKDTHQEFHGSKDRRNCSSDYRSHRLHHHRRSRRSRSRDRSGVRSRSRSSSRSRSRYLSRSPPKKYNKGRSRSRTRNRSRYRSRSPPKMHSRDDYYSRGPEDPKPKSTSHRQEMHRTSSGGHTKSGNSHGDNCVQTHSATRRNWSSEQEKKDLLTKADDAHGVGKGGKNDTGKE
ncbi:uncharacterized protein LOC115689214 [Syzygium oleosum]|uniref:uncharacterized protein LOC115689214 n=1 Tax=Syzygium oleosum TaxID=219896 RepID=UPI0011D1A097|nr:uncharacterized protein LOC115689214 [Syzygium oleosum]XP_056174297.1 uncharacterized protein LOC115689214 [Syzygium oleosum]